MPLPSIQKISRSSARDEVHARLREWIVAGPLEPGEAIRDTEIAARLGVSRTPVREAIVKLEREGLVEVAPGRWTRVAPLRFEQAENLYNVGAVLDALAAEQATPRLTEKDLVAMQRVNDSLLDTDDPPRLQAADEAFHEVYLQAAYNPILLDHYYPIRDELRRLERVNFGDPFTPEVAHREHVAILQAMRAGDARRAAEAARFNWSNAWPRVQEMLDLARHSQTHGVAGDEAPEE